jgi:NitT/TauT family transport system ATP-binding protein
MDVTEKREIILTLHDVSKEFISVEGGEVQAIEDINIQIEEGEFLSIIGPSGCGKTTLLRIIAALERPTKGEVVFHNKDQKNIHPTIGLIFQEFALLPWRTVVGNIEFGLEIRGTKKEEREARALEYIKIIELEGFENKYPKELSGGMKQRVAIARAIVCDPKILLMDEPFGSLDAQTRFNMQKFLLRIWNRTKKTILFVTHNVDEAIFLSQRMIILSERPGKVLSETTIELEYPRDINDSGFIQIRKKALEYMIAVLITTLF